MNPPDVLSAAGRDAQADLVAAALHCRQPERLAPVVQLVDEDAFPDPALRALWRAFREWYYKHRRPPTPEELWRSVRTDGLVDRAGGWAFVERLASVGHSGRLEAAALDLVAAHGCSALRARLARAMRSLEGLSTAGQAVQALERLALEARTAAAAIRALADHERNMPRHMLDYVRDLLRGHHAGPRGAP